MSLDPHALILECVFVLAFFAFGRFLSIFAIGIIGRIIVGIIVYACLSSLNPALLHYWAGIAGIALFIIGAFWRDRYVLVNVYYRIKNAIQGISYRFEYNRSEKKAYQKAQKEYEQATDEAKDYSERFQQSQNEYEQAKQRAEEAEHYYRQKAQQAEKDAQSHYQNQEQQNTERKLDPSNINDAYEILGVPNGASLEECKKAYKRLMQIYHPDKIAQFTGWRREKAEEDAKLINQAFKFIKTH